LGRPNGLLIGILAAAASVAVAGTAPRLASEGEVIDAVLADRRFATWLDQQPESTWSTANVYIEDWLKGAPQWQVELFREIDVPRNYAIGAVDPFTGKLESLRFCNDPCLR
jgi:hypothetical protein